MQAHIIYNAYRRGLFQPSPEDLSTALKQSGYDPFYHLTNSPQELENLFEEIEGIVVAAGGDGTIRETAIRLMDRAIPLVPLPMGAANNICHTLGIVTTPEVILSHLADPVKIHFDVGEVHAPWGEDYFVETMGYGLYAEILATYDPEKGKNFLRTLASISTSVVRHSEPERKILVDGEDVSGRYLLLEVHNIPAFGPGIRLAQDADPSDGLLDVVLVQEEAYENLAHYAISLAANELEDLPVFEVHRARQVQIQWEGFPIHVDAHVRPLWLKHPITEDYPSQPPEEHLPEKGTIQVSVRHAAVELWLPNFVNPPDSDRNRTLNLQLDE